MTQELLAKKSNLMMPTHYAELDNEEMSYVDGGLYLSNATCSAITALCAGATLAGTGVACAGAIAGVNMIAKGTALFSSLGSKIISAVFSFCAAHPWAIGVVALIGVWASCNKDNILELGVNIVKAAVNGYGVNVGLSWFTLWSNIA